MNRFFSLFIAILFAALAFECKGPQTTKQEPTPEGGATLKLDTILRGLDDAPWGLEFLPDGSMLVTLRGGFMLRHKAGKSDTIGGLPPIRVDGQGGLLDVKLHPQYAENGWIYFSYSAPSPEGNSKGNTAIMRARLKGNQLIDQQLLFKGLPDSQKSHHYGNRIVFDKDNYMFFGIGDRGDWDNAQLLTNHCGKIHRLRDDGTVPPDNPFVNTPGAMGSIWSYGIRNPQGLIFHPTSGDLWETEHGPKGGDELNIVRKGVNYGWPLITYGINYNGIVITPDTAKAGMEQPVIYWRPSIAPCGMEYVSSNRYPDLKGGLLLGSLSFQYLHFVMLDGQKVVKQEKYFPGIGRVRCVKESPDGYIYFTTDTGNIFRIR